MSNEEEPIAIQINEHESIQHPQESPTDEQESIASPSNEDESTQDAQDSTSQLHDQEDESEDEPVESLVQGRHRRSTQANKYSALLEQETVGEDGDDDDELALYFAQAEEEDIEFEDPANLDSSDAADDDSSTDDEDHGNDELDGEEQLQKEERIAKQAQKRQSEKKFVKPLPVLKKRVKIDASATTSDTASSNPTVAERKRKLSERISWVPTDAPARTSSRTLSVQNKARTIASMKESESRRIRLIAAMEASQKRKDANKAKPKTQAERMAEAAETERVNSQSLNKWEELEEERRIKQKAKLDALQNRTIDGPFIRFYSGRGEWEDGKLNRIGKNLVTEVIMDRLGGDGEPKKRAYKKKNRLQDENATKESTPAASMHSSGVHTKEESPSKDKPVKTWGKPKDDLIDTPTVEEDSEQRSKTIYDQSDLFASQTDQAENTMGSTATAGNKDELWSKDDNDKNKTLGNGGEELPDEIVEQEQSQETAEAKRRDKVSETNDGEQTLSFEKAQGEQQTGEDKLLDSSGTDNQDHSQLISSETPIGNEIAEPAEQSKIEAPKITKYATRNLITLHNFDPTSIQDPSVLRQVVMGTPLPRNFTPAVLSTRLNAKAIPQGAPKPTKAVCVITGHPAKYLDPATRLPYANLQAYKAIRKLVDGGCVWSSLLGAWCGSDGSAVHLGGTGGAAKGVPDGFVTGVIPEPARAENGDGSVKTEVV